VTVPPSATNADFPGFHADHTARECVRAQQCSAGWRPDYRREPHRI
jgi:hypothetical protein